MASGGAVNLRTLGRIGWAALGSLLVGLGFFALLPYVRSDAPGVFWPPSAVQCGVAAVLVFCGLTVSRRAERLQYLTFAAAAGLLVLFCKAVRAAMEVGGVTGIS